MSKNRINIDTSIILATQDFKIIGEVEYDEYGQGSCCEGHPIKYGIEVSDEEGNIFIFGNECIAKPFILKHWELEPEMINNPDVIKAGKYLWIIARDGLADYIEDIPHPKDLQWDFKKLKEILKEIVVGAKKKKNKYLKELKKQEKWKMYEEQFEDNYPEQYNLIEQLIKKVKRLKDNNTINLLNSWEKEFIVSVIGQHKTLKVLSEKQLSIIERLLTVAKPDKNLDKEINNKITRLINMVDKFDDYNTEFIFSIQRQFYDKGTLTEKQLNHMDKILDGDNELQQYVGREMRSWITEKKVGISGVRGKIVSVLRKTGMAIQCNFEVNGEIFDDVWIPISQIHMEEEKNK